MIQIHPDFLKFKRPSPHSKFSPSAVDRWILGACPFSVEFAKNIPSESSVYSEEGTVAHSLCEAVFYQTFLGSEIPYELQMAMLKYDGREMLDCAHAYVEILTHWLNNKEVIGDILHYGLEVGVPVYPEEGCFGTADFLLVGTKASVVIDFKYGKGKNVKADTLQLKVYAAGIAKHLVGAPDDYMVHVVVFQPRTDAFPKEHSYTMGELDQFLLTINYSITAAGLPDGVPNEGNHCFWCPAKRTKDNSKKCPLILEKPMKIAAENFAQFMVDMNAPIDRLGDPNQKRDEAIIKLRTLYPMIKEVVENSEEEFKMRLEDGENIPGVRLVESLGNRELTVDGETLAKELGINPYKEVPATKKLRTISDIEKEIGKNKLDHMCVRKRSIKVDVLDDKMQAVLGEMAKYAEMIKTGQGQE